MTKPQSASDTISQSTSSQHVKTNHWCTTTDGWSLHLVRTQQPDVVGSRLYPVLLCPGLGSSGAYSFDLSPTVSLADYLASLGYDVWTAELRGNGQSDKPSVFKRSRWWTIDDYVEKDIPAIINYVVLYAGCSKVHFLGHSMGGMILTGAVGRNDDVSARIHSCTLIGSGCFLQGSWWQAIEPTIGAARLLYTVPAGSALQLYSRLAFTRMAIPALDILYFWPSNVDPALARALLSRNFSDISPGVVLQMKTAFKERGLLSAHSSQPFAAPEVLGRVHQPVLVIVGDRDKMCPPQGCIKTFQLFGSKEKQLVVLGPKSGQKSHYGHFDILMGKRVVEEVFPMLRDWLGKHDVLKDRVQAPAAAAASAVSVRSRALDHPQPYFPQPSHPTPSPVRSAPSGEASGRMPATYGNHSNNGSILSADQLARSGHPGEASPAIATCNTTDSGLPSLDLPASTTLVASSSNQPTHPTLPCTSPHLSNAGDTSASATSSSTSPHGSQPGGGPAGVQMEAAGPYATKGWGDSNGVLGLEEQERCSAQEVAADKPVLATGMTAGQGVNLGLAAGGFVHPGGVGVQASGSLRLRSKL